MRPISREINPMYALPVVACVSLPILVKLRARPRKITTPARMIRGFTHADGGRIRKRCRFEFKDERFERLMVSLEDPTESAARINEKAQAD